MNSSYGNFGKKSELLITKNVKIIDLIKYVGTHIIKNIITINDNWSTVLMKNNLLRPFPPLRRARGCGLKIL